MNHPTCRSARPHHPKPCRWRTAAEAKAGAESGSAFRAAPAVDVPNRPVPAALRPGGPGLRNGNARGLGHPVGRAARSGWGRQSAELSGVPLTEMPAALAAAIALALPALSYPGDPRER